MTNKKIKVILLGAGGREFHNFNVCFKNNPQYQVVAFTAAQIPNIENRIFPAVLSGSFYPKGISIFPEAELPELIKKHKVDEVIFAYSDISHTEVMRAASLALSLGADFRLLGPKSTMLKSKMPVISVCAVRTGAGKSPVTRKLLKIFQGSGKKAVIVRHPMPYGNLAKQVFQKFEKLEDLDKAECTIEEREEYEPLIAAGAKVFAGVDYKRILREAEKEADIIVWDGGNNDFPFFKSDFLITCCDPHRPGDEIHYYPGETNLRMADVVVITKQGTANPQEISRVLENVKKINPQAIIINARSKIYCEKAELLRSKSVLVIEDGPTITHGGMPFGAGVVFARRTAKRIIDPRPWAKGSLFETFKKYPHIRECLPAIGYGKEQIQDLEATINSVPAEAVISATPIDLRGFTKIDKPVFRVFYELEEIGKPDLKEVLKKFNLI